MAVTTERIEARLSPDERALIERAATLTGLSTSAFLVGAAVDQADRVLSASWVTAVPEDYFDQLVQALDEPEAAPGLRAAAASSRERQRIARG